MSAAVGVVRHSHSPAGRATGGAFLLAVEAFAAQIPGMGEQQRVRLTGLDCLRTGAVGLVVLYHVNSFILAKAGVDMIPAIRHFGHSGVDLFFVMSGFVLYWIHGKDIGNPAVLRSYATRRAERVYPVYWVALALTVAALAAKGEAISPTTMLAAITVAPSPIDLPLYVAWTLKYELVFYTIFGVALVSKRIAIAAGALWCLAPLIGCEPYAIHFTLGICVAIKCRNAPARRPKSLIALAAVAFVALATAGADGHVGRVLYAIASAVLVTGVSSLDLTRRSHWPQPIVRLGQASYSIYLVHYAAISAAGGVAIAAGAPAYAAAAVAIIAAFALSLAFYQAIEVPLNQAIQRRHRLANGVTAAATKATA